MTKAPSLRTIVWSLIRILIRLKIWLEKFQIEEHNCRASIFRKGLMQVREMEM